MPVNPSRDDFPSAVIDILARRVGMHCSNPGCRQPTTGPRADESRAVNIGVAAHITAAAAGGPRYDPALTPEQRRSAENGIWLCQNHAKLIDNDVLRYPADLLREWKRTAEEAAHRELIGRSQHQSIQSAQFEAGIFPAKGNFYSPLMIYTLEVPLRNVGAKTVRGVVVEIEHDETHCIGMRAAEGVWLDESPAGIQNPKRLRLRQNLNPEEFVVVLGIPTVADTQFPFSVRLKVWAEDMPMIAFAGAITEERAAAGTYIPLVMGSHQPGQATRVSSRPQPISKAGQKLLAEILESPDVENRGITEILAGYPGDSLSAAYMCTTAQFVNPQFGHPKVRGMKKRAFREGMNELLLLGWLYEPEEGGATALYEFNPEDEP